MAKMRIHLADGQNMGYVQIRDGKPYYGYSEREATNLDVNYAKYLARTFKPETYRVFIICTPEEEPPKWNPYTIVYK